MQLVVAAARGQHDGALDGGRPEDVAVDDARQVRHQGEAVVGGLADQRVQLGAQEDGVGALDAGEAQLGHGLRDGLGNVVDVRGHRDREVRRRGADPVDGRGAVAVEDGAVLGERDALRRVLQRIPVGVLASPLHAVDLGPRQRERHAQLDDGPRAEDVGLHAVVRRLDLVQPAEADGGEVVAVRAGHVDDAAPGDVALERALGLLLDVRPRGVRDGGQAAMQVVHEVLLPRSPMPSEPSGVAGDGSASAGSPVRLGLAGWSSRKSTVGQ